MINAIETRYAGCHFRSRLEARWAVFFDALSIEWQYEPQGFNVGSTHAGWVSYLPDFYLPTTQTWVEVKGDLTDVDWRKIEHAIIGSEGKLPAVHEGFDRTGSRATPGLLLLGNVPRPLPGHTPTFPLLQHHQLPNIVSCRDVGVLSPATFIENVTSLAWLSRQLPDVPVEYQGWFGHTDCASCRGVTAGDEWLRTLHKIWPEAEGWVKQHEWIPLNRALTTARSHRFGT